MTQTSLKLIVPLPENDVTGFRRASLSRACGGHDTIADVLNFFIYKASGVAQHLKIEEVEFVRIERCSLDAITERVKVSKRTLHSYIKQLETWGYLKAYPYHQTYDIYFQKITDALANPPAPPPPKLRGRHVLRSLTPDEQMLKLQSRYAELEEEMSKLTSQMSKLTSQKLDLTSQMSNLTFEKSKLTSQKSCEAASNQEVTGDFGEDRIIEYKESKEREEENDIPLSCSFSLSENAPSQEQVTTGSEEEHQQLQNALPETSSEYETDEPPESQNPLSIPEKKTPPAWIEHLPKVTSKQYKMPDTLFVQPKEVPEPKPLTKNEQRKVDEAEVEAYWSLAEEVLQTTYPYGVRSNLANSRGVMGIIGERRYLLADIKLGLERLNDFEIRTFTWEKFHLWLPGLLSGKYKQQQKPAAHSSRPLDIAPQPGGWGRRLDGAMMPGTGRVRHD